MITDDDKKFLHSFESCSLGATCWNHAAHIRMAWLVLETSVSFEQALVCIKTGIQRFNSTNNSIGYHETITVAFARIIETRRQADDSWISFSERNNDLFEKSCLNKFYSSEILRSENARHNFVDSDLMKLPLDR